MKGGPEKNKDKNDVGKEEKGGDLLKSAFDSHLKKHVLKIGRDAYIYPDDPFYIEKVLRYKQESPEVHYRMGLEHERKGRYSRALFHYIEAMRFDSNYYSKARKALVHLENKVAGKNRGKTSQDSPSILDSKLSKILIIILLLSNCIFISLLYIQLF